MKMKLGVEIVEDSTYSKCFDRNMTFHQTKIYLPDFYFPTRPLNTSSYQAAKKRPSLPSLHFRRPTHGPPTLPLLTAWCILLTKLESSFSIWQDLRFWLAWCNLQEKKVHRCVFIILSGNNVCNGKELITGFFRLWHKIFILWDNK